MCFAKSVKFKTLLILCSQLAIKNEQQNFKNDLQNLDRLQVMFAEFDIVTQLVLSKPEDSGLIPAITNF